MEGKVNLGANKYKENGVGWDGKGEMKKEKKGKKRGGSCKKKGGAWSHTVRDKQAKNKGGKNARVPARG